jgi:uncharacterized repeat protein (TIGR02543 family)
MKKNLIRLMSLFLSCLLLCVSVPVVRAENINLGVDIQNGTDEITVTIDNSADTNAVLADENPVLVIDCPFSPAHVKYGDAVVASSLTEDKITFTVSKGGVYKVIKGNPPADPDDPADPTYTVTYQSNGGSAVASVSNLSSGSKLTEPADPSRSGYTFNGWYQDAACTDEWDFDTNTVSGDMTLYAGWTEILPVVTGVTVTPAAADVKQGKTQQFTAAITGTNVSGVAVTWSVTGAKDTATVIDSTGKLTVGSKETEDLTVIATAGGKTGTATVDVKQVYTITVGNWRKGSGKDLTVYVNAPVAELLNVRIDGEILNTNRYTAFGTTGTTIKLKNSYLETCPAGTYSIEVEYEDGDAEETFKIKKEIVNAETGDFFNLYLWIGMLVLSFSAVVVLLAMRRKRKW